jgi:hypothetical protein
MRKRRHIRIVSQLWSRISSEPAYYGRKSRTMPRMCVGPLWIPAIANFAYSFGLGSRRERRHLPTKRLSSGRPKSHSQYQVCLSSGIRRQERLKRYRRRRRRPNYRKRWTNAWCVLNAAVSCKVPVLIGVVYRASSSVQRVGKTCARQYSQSAYTVRFNIQRHSSVTEIFFA